MAIPTEKPSYGPLDGVKVVYAAVELACPKAADLMADWGADVVWLENTGAGDTIRDTAYVKQAERRNQRSVALNYFSEEGKKVFFDLVKDADIFMEASKGGTWARKGITDDVLWELNPKMVIVHVSGFGQEGDPKMVKRAAYDLTVMAYSGIIMQNGTEEQPMLPGPYAGDYFNTLMIASSALAASTMTRTTGSVPEGRSSTRPESPSSASAASTAACTAALPSTACLSFTRTLISVCGKRVMTLATSSMEEPARRQAARNCRAVTKPSPVELCSRKIIWPLCSPPRTKPPSRMASST